MEDNKIRCMRCRGYKRLFKVGSAYSTVDTGGVKVDCPMCLGTGVIDSLENAIEEVSKKIDKTTEITQPEKVEDKKGSLVNVTAALNEVAKKAEEEDIPVFVNLEALEIKDEDFKNDKNVRKKK